MAVDSITTSRQTTDDEGLTVRAAKRQRLPDRLFASAPAPTKLSHDDYTVGWICALSLEMAAATAMLDSKHDTLPKVKNDINTYTLGCMATHNVVIACLPSGGYGNNNAAAVASNMRRSFPHLRLCLMVGIGGGVPGRVDIRLGDVVVGEGVLQYDLGKNVGEGNLMRTASINKPPAEFLTAVAKLHADHDETGSQIPSLLEDMFERKPGMKQYMYHDSLQDRLFDSAYDHVESTTAATDNCELCDTSGLVQRPVRDNPNPRIHRGIVASGNQVMKHGKSRDELACALNALCFEMEGSGVMDGFAGLVIRGICDYSDSHKNKQWQNVAAAIAAAYAKELLSIMPAEVRMPLPIMAAPNDDIDAERYQTLSNSLKFDQIDARRLNIRAKHNNTCQWLLEHPAYLDWLDPTRAVEHHGFLWIRGGPGTGKSTIMNYAYTESAKNKQKTILSFFFNARGQALERSIEGMYRSLLHQLLRVRPSLCNVFDEPVHQHSVNQLYTAIREHKNYIWPVAVLQSLLRTALARLSADPLTIFVDALDECPMTQVEELVEYFEDVGTNAVDNGTQLSICFSSRYYPQIQIQCCHKIDLEEQEGHEKDIAMYIRNKLTVGTGKAACQVKEEVQNKAKGIFMWVVLVVDILKTEYRNGRIFDVKKRLAALPEKLSSLFKEILTRDQVNLGDLRLCIQWILFANRPLKLEEYYFAAVSELNPDELCEWDPENITTDAMHRFVTSSSKGLVETTKTKVRTVQFIHESVREFFLKDGLPELWPNVTAAEFESASHSQLQRCCNAYLRFSIAARIYEQLSIPQPLPKPSSDETKQLRESVSTKFPFLEYAIFHILSHANAAADKIPQHEFLKDFPVYDWVLLGNLFARYESRRHSPDVALMYILAESNCEKLIMQELVLSPEDVIRGKRNENPLFAALANSYPDAASALLRIAPGHPDEEIVARLDYGSNVKIGKNQTPLSWAAANGHVDFVRLLLKRGHDMETVDERKRTPLMLALKDGHTSTAQLLLDSGASHWAMDNALYTPLIYAIEAGNELMFRLLLGKASYAAYYNHGQHPLMAAAGSGNEAIVHFLLKEGAHVDEQPPWREREDRQVIPLTAAVSNGWEAVARLLLANGADITAKRIFVGTPVEAAVKGNSEAILHLLFENVTHVTAKDPNSQSPLTAAVYAGDEASVRTLLENGEDATAKDTNGRTPLLIAVYRGYESIVRLLFENGLDDMATNTDHDAILSVAVYLRHDAIVQLLLDKGADLNRISLVVIERSSYY